MCLKSSVLPQGGLEKTRPNKNPGVSIWQERVVLLVLLGIFLAEEEELTIFYDSTR